MKVLIRNVYTDREWMLEGSACQIEEQIAVQFPWVYAQNPKWSGDPAAMLRYLAAQQAYVVEVVDTRS